MAKRKVKTKNKFSLPFASVSIVLLGAFSVFWLYHENIIPTATSQLKTEKTGVTFYPRQYSDAHITTTAMITDSRFEHLAQTTKLDLTANVISSGLPIYRTLSDSNSPEKGTWLWTPTLSITPEYQKSIIAGAKKNGIKNIYISIDTFLDIFVMPDGAEKEAARKKFDDTLQSFIALAHKSGMTVDAEGGWRNWAENGNTYKAFAVLDYAIQFNKTHAEKLRGFQYDVEPYLLDSYKKDKATTLTNFVNLISESAATLGDSDLQLSVVIPEFYDGTNNETPKFIYDGESGYALDHLLHVLEQRPGSDIIVMSYRNFSAGDDGSIDVSKDEINDANKYQTKIIIAQETGDVNPPYVTFHNTSHSYLNRQLQTIQSTFAKDKSFGGIAVHYVNALMDLK